MDLFPTDTFHLKILAFELVVLNLFVLSASILSCCSDFILLIPNPSVINVLNHKMLSCSPNMEPLFPYTLPFLSPSVSVAPKSQFVTDQHSMFWNHKILSASVMFPCLAGPWLVPVSPVSETLLTQAFLFIAKPLASCTPQALL